MFFQLLLSSVALVTGLESGRVAQVARDIRSGLVDYTGFDVALLPKQRLHLLERLQLFRTFIAVLLCATLLPIEGLVLLSSLLSYFLLVDSFRFHLPNEREQGCGLGFLLGVLYFAIVLLMVY